MNFVPKYKAVHKTQVYTEAQQNVETNCNTIRFTNKGTDDATILNNIPLPAGSWYEFDNTDPLVIIKDPINLIFAGASGHTKEVLVIRKYIEYYK